MAKRSFPLSKVYILLESGPVVMVATAWASKMNVMPMSWHTMMEFKPPLIGFVMSDQNYSFGPLTATKECVINIPTIKIAEEVVSCACVRCQNKQVRKIHLTPKPAAKVKAPLIDECYANLECRVADKSMVEKYCFFVVEVVKAWIDPAVKDPLTIHHMGKEDFMIAGKTIKIKPK